MNVIVERLLERRGLSGEALDGFLDPSLKRLSDASSLPGIGEAVDVIIPFIRDRRKIVVFGDYDCDGVCASAILVKTFRKLGAVADAFVPDRFAEGYGMTPASVERLLREHPDAALVVTVDCGITSAAEVKMLKDRGVAVVVTDHHLPPETLPACDALVDPKTDAQREVARSLGAEDLCGAGLAFFLAGAIAARAAATGMYGGGKFGAPLLVLAGLATVVDIVPLLGQNRILAFNALRTFRSAPVGLRELLLRAQRRPAVDDVLTSRDFGFLLGPRINAAGRMASAVDSYRLLMEDDREEARSLAQKVDAYNLERKSIEIDMTNAAEQQIGGAVVDAIVVGEEGSGGSEKRKGVCGIVASRLMERHRVPVAVAVDGRGSARAPDGYDVHAALSACADLLERFGGHKAAGGFSVKEGKFAEFRKAFSAACAEQSARLPPPVQAPQVVDEWLEPSDLTMELYGDLRLLEPYGEGNPEPVFGLRGVALDARPLGDNGRHMAATFPDQRIPRATWWNHGDEVEGLQAAAYRRFDITFTLDTGDWGGDEPHLELRLRSISPSAAEG